MDIEFSIENKKRNDFFFYNLLMLNCFGIIEFFPPQRFI